MLDCDSLLLNCGSRSGVCGCFSTQVEASCSLAERQLAKTASLVSPSYCARRFDDLSNREEFKIILEEVSALHDRLAVLQGRSSLTVELIRNIAFQSTPHKHPRSGSVLSRVPFWFWERVQKTAL